MNLEEIKTIRDTIVDYEDDRLLLAIDWLIKEVEHLRNVTGHDLYYDAWNLTFGGEK